MIKLISIWLFNTAKQTTFGWLVITATSTVGRPVNIPTYPVGRPISPTTPPSANWSLPQHTPSAAPSPHCWPTGHHPHIPRHPTVGRLVITPTYPVGCPINPTTPLSADWSSPKPYCRPTGHHPHIPHWPPHQPHHPTVGRLVITQNTPSADWWSLQHTLSAAPLAHQPQCRPTHY